MHCSRSPEGACSLGMPGPWGPAPGGACSGVWMRPPAQQMATVADGTHPTGMHSCLINVFVMSTPGYIDRLID